MFGGGTFQLCHQPWVHFWPCLAIFGHFLLIEPKPKSATFLAFLKNSETTKEPKNSVFVVSAKFKKATFWGVLRFCLDFYLDHRKGAHSPKTAVLKYECFINYYVTSSHFFIAEWFFSIAILPSNSCPSASKDATSTSARHPAAPGLLRGKARNGSQLDAGIARGLFHPPLWPSLITFMRKGKHSSHVWEWGGNTAVSAA